MEGAAATAEEGWRHSASWPWPFAQWARGNPRLRNRRRHEMSCKPWHRPGSLRAALYLGGPTNVVKDPSGEMKGMGYELGKELARRMGVPYEPVIYQTPKLLAEDINSGK